MTLVTTTDGTNAPLNLNAVGSGNVVMNQAGTGITVFTTGMSITNNTNVALATTTGTIIATTTLQKLGFYAATPVVQPVAAVGVTTGTTGGSTGVSLDTTFKGSTGSSAYTITGIVTCLKALGLIAA